MDLNATRMFVTAVQSGSLSAAALRLNVPLPTLSRRIRRLERDLRVQLIERGTRGVTLTRAGMQFYETTGFGIDALLKAEDVLRSGQAQYAGVLRVSLPPSFEPWWDMLGAFQERYPHIKVCAMTSERNVDLRHEGIDVALQLGRIIDDRMVARRLVSYRHVLVASPSLAERLNVRSPDELPTCPCAVWSSHPADESSWRIGDKVLRDGVRFVTNDYLHLRIRALRGEVVTELPPFLAAEPIRNGTLRVLFPELAMPLQYISLVYPSHRHPSSLVRAYLDYCEEHVASFATLASQGAPASTASRPPRA
ncbi:LysR family transcriptional regulator [Paraburkholderia bengalensis]|uniref:LysR family transcriptional regulator n=1 Tax=Paraburkholderia bengalensis TaxID=2747562 RepID=A0ABU8J574_9BURK